MGVTEPPVSPVAWIAHLATGSELVDARSQPATGLIRDSNSPLVAASRRGSRCRGYFMRVFRRASNGPWRSWSRAGRFAVGQRRRERGSLRWHDRNLTRLGFVVRCSKCEEPSRKAFDFRHEREIRGVWPAEIRCRISYVFISSSEGDRPRWLDAPPQRTICVHLEGSRRRKIRETCVACRLRAQEGRP